MEFDKTSTYMTVSRSVNGTKRRETVVLFKRCLSVPTATDMPQASFVFTPSSGTVELDSSVDESEREAKRNGWLTADTDNAGDLYYIEAVLNFTKSDESVTITTDMWSNPIRQPDDRDILFSITPNKYYRNERYQVGIAQKIKVEMKVIGYKSTPVLKCSEQSYVKGSYLEIPYRTCEDSIEIYACINGRVVKSIVLYVEDVTDKPVYLGIAKTTQEAKTKFNSYANDGKLYTMVYYPDDGQTVENGHIRGELLYKDGENFDSMPTVTKDNATVFLDMVLDVTSDGSLSDGVISWFRDIVVDKIVANNIIAKNIDIYKEFFVEYGVTKYKGMHFEASSETPTFKIQYDGIDVFKIDPSTGNIIFGDSIYYDKTTHSLRSINGQFVISSDGVCHLTEADISGTSTFRGKFECLDVFSTEQTSMQSTPYTSTNGTKAPKEIYDALKSTGLANGDLRRANITEYPECKWISLSMEKVSKSGINAVVYGLVMYNDKKEKISPSTYTGTLNVDTKVKAAGVTVDFGSYIPEYLLYYGSVSGWYISGGSVYKCPSEGLHMTIWSGGNRIKMILPSDTNGLPDSCIYRDANGYLKVYNPQSPAE